MNTHIMFNSENKTQFNICPLVTEMEQVLQNGLKKLLSNYMDRYEMLEKTHMQIMNLPSVQYEVSTNRGIEGTTNNTEICESTLNTGLEERLEKIEQKYDNLQCVLNNILNKLNEIQNEKCNSSKENFDVKKPLIVKMSENEHVSLNIEEVSQKEFYENVKNETEVEEEKVEEEQDEKQVEEQVEEQEEQEEQVEEEQAEEQEEVEEEQEEEQVEEEEEEQVEEEEEEQVEEEEEQVEEEQVEEQEEQDEEEASIETETKQNETEQDEDNGAEAEDDEELFEIEIDDKTYCTNNEQNGFIWELTEDGEQGEKIGYLEDGEAYFYEEDN